MPRYLRPPPPIRPRTRSFELSEHITGSITFTGVQPTAPVLLVKLAVVRIEYADEEVTDAVIFDDAIMDARRWRTRKMARAGADVLARLRPAAAAAGGGGGGVDDDDDEAAGDDVEGGADGGGGKRRGAADEAADAAEAGHAAEPQPSLAAAAGISRDELRALEAWVPTPEDLAADEPDADLPVTGACRACPRVCAPRARAL